MISGQDIIYVGNDWYTENKTSSHHIAEILAKSNRVLYIEGAGQRAPNKSIRDVRKAISKINKIGKKTSRIEETLFVFSPFIIPLHRYSLVQLFNSLLIRIQVKKALYDSDMHKTPLVWILMPHYYSIADSIKKKGLIYYCVDNYASQPGVNADAITKMEDYILAQADVVFTVSERLFEEKKRKAKNVYLSLHGVDIEHFGQTPSTIPIDIVRIPKPIAGFFGLIEEWIDLDLLAYLASQNKDISFVLIGRVVQDVTKLENMNNVYFLGEKPYQSLPGYLSAFDAGLLPYKLNKQVVFSNPKKMREYLAAGKPVVSIRIKEVERYRDYIYISDNYEQFNGNLKSALNDNTIEKARKRKKIMKLESWESRVVNISEIVKKCIKC